MRSMRVNAAYLESSLREVIEKYVIEPQNVETSRNIMKE